MADVKSLQDRPARSPSCEPAPSPALCHIRIPAGLQDLGYDVLATAVPRLEVHAPSFGMPVRTLAAMSGAR